MLPATQHLRSVKRFIKKMYLQMIEKTQVDIGDFVIIIVMFL